MPSGKVTAQYDSEAPAAPNSGESVIFPLGPNGNWFQRLPSGDIVPLFFDAEQILGVLFDDRNRSALITEDWGGSGVGGSYGWVSSTATGGSTAIVSAEVNDYNRQGILRCRVTGNTGAGARAAICRGTTGTKLIGQGEVVVSINANILSSALALAQNARAYFGLTNAVTANPPVNGVYFLMDLNVSTNFLCVSVQASNATIVDSGVAVLGEVYNNLSFRSNGVDEIEFFINGNSVAVIDTNLPYGGDDFLTEFCGLYRSAAGTTDTMDVLIDSYYLKQLFGAPRW